MSGAFDHEAPCPVCAMSLADADIAITNTLPAEADPEGKAKLDILITCDHCGAELNTFVAIEDLLVIGED